MPRKRENAACFQSPAPPLQECRVALLMKKAEKKVGGNVSFRPLRAAFVSSGCLG